MRIRKIHKDKRHSFYGGTVHALCGFTYVNAFEGLCDTSWRRVNCRNCLRLRRPRTSISRGAHGISATNEGRGSAVLYTVHRQDGKSYCGRCQRLIAPNFDFCPGCGGRYITKTVPTQVVTFTESIRGSLFWNGKTNMEDTRGKR